MRVNENHKINNDGLSLIELIIVLAIIAIIGAATYLSLSMATNKQVSSCADKIRTSLEQARNLTLGKQSGSIQITKDGSVYAQITVNGQPYGDKVPIGVDGLTVTYVTSDSATPHTLDSTNPINIEFSRSTGGVKDNPYVKSITVTNGNRTCIIEIDHFTGRVTVRTV